MTLNGIALLIAAGFAALVGVVCYAWGYWDGREDARKDGRRTWARHGREGWRGRRGHGANRI